MATRRRPWILRTATALVVIVLGVLAFKTLDWTLVLQVLRQANWARLPMALLMMAISYIALSYAYGITCRIFGLGVAWRDLMPVAFVSMVINHLVAAGGVVGYSLRVAVLRKYDASASDVLATSVFNAYIGSLVFLATLPFALGYFFFSHTLNAQQTIGIIMVMVFLAVGFIVATAVILAPRVRGWVLGQLARVIQWVRRGRDDTAKGLATFDAAMIRGTAAVRRHPEELVMLLLVTACDWAAAMLCLGFCFRALGTVLPWSVLLTCYVLGLSVGLISMIPGGLGIQEGSMAGLFHLYGVSWEQATLATVLFRVIYYFVPVAISLVFYRRLTGGPDVSGEAQPADVAGD